MRAFKQLWALVSVAGTLSWLLSLGIGGFLSALLASLIELESPWRGIFFASVLLIVTALSVPPSQWAMAHLLLLLKPPERPPSESQLADQQRTRAIRAAIHEAITTLEYQRGQVATRGFSRGYQGGWGENRGLLAQEPEYDRAVRATERAFQALDESESFADPAGHVGGPIQEALVELERAL